MDLDVLTSFRNQVPSIIHELQQVQQSLSSLGLSPVSIGDPWQTKQNRRSELLETLSWIEPALELISQVANTANELERVCRKQVDRARASLVPWTSMPSEITLVIFDFVMLDIEIAQINRQALRLSSISWYHRHIALSTCRLWTYVSVPQAVVGPSSLLYLPTLNILHTFARRARASPTILSATTWGTYLEAALWHRKFLVKLDEPPVFSSYVGNDEERFEIVWAEDLRMVETLTIEGSIEVYSRDVQFPNIIHLHLHLTQHHTIQNEIFCELLRVLPCLNTLTLETDGDVISLKYVLGGIHHSLNASPDYLSNLHNLIVIVDVDYENDVSQSAWSADVKEPLRLVVDSFNSQHTRPGSAARGLRLYAHHELVSNDEVSWYVERLESLRLYSDEWSRDWTDFMEKDDIDPVTLPGLLAQSDAGFIQSLAEVKQNEEDGESDDCSDSEDSDDDDSGFISTAELQDLYDEVPDAGADTAYTRNGMSSRSRLRDILRDRRS